MISRRSGDILKIMLDAGHGYSTAGKRSPDGMKEYEFTRVVANFAKQFLESYQNVTVYFAHSDDRDVPLQERTNKANELKVDVYVSIHANAYGSNWNDANGIETYIHPRHSQVSTELAQKIQRYLIISTGLKDRGVKTADFHVLRETTMPAVLVECGFYTNHQEATLLRSETYRRTCADAIVKAIVDQYNLTKKANKPDKEPTPSSVNDGLYKVQVGAFREKKYADELVEALKKQGYEPYVYFDK